MKNKFQKPNIIDFATIVVVILLIAMGAIYYLRKPVIETGRLSVTVEVTDPAQVEIVKSSALTAKNVFLNSVDVPVSATSNLQGPALQITLSGSGHIDTNGDYFFNGQRILVGQKAEIHGSYFAQGKIVKIENAE